MIQVEVRLLGPPEKRDEIARVLLSRIERIRAERGCLGCHLYRDLEDRQTLRFVEFWSDLADLKRHARTESFRELLLWLDLSICPPEVSFRSINAECGLEFLPRLCGHSGAVGDGEPISDSRTLDSGRCHRVIQVTPPATAGCVRMNNLPFVKALLDQEIVR